MGNAYGGLLGKLGAGVMIQSQNNLIDDFYKSALSQNSSTTLSGCGYANTTNTIITDSSYYTPGNNYNKEPVKSKKSPSEQWLDRRVSEMCITI